MRDRNGGRVWVLSSRTVADNAKGRPELLLSTAIDITAQKETQAWLCGIRDVTSAPRRPDRENAEMADLSRMLAILLQRASQALRPANLPRMGRPETQEFLLVLEEMKMLMSELEVLGLFRKENGITEE
jgi:hypothetical protein